MLITALFAAMLALLFVVLSVRVIGARRGAKVSIGDGGDRQLARRVRVHANFAEYTPFALILMGTAENLGAWKLGIWAIGALLLTGRLLHAYGVSQEPEQLTFRVTGMAMTFTAIILGAICCLAISLEMVATGGVRLLY
jgi:uncharacterized protein